MGWHSKPTGGYALVDLEAEENAKQIFYTLHSWAWGLGAIAGVLGNLQYESGLNPWRWESDIVLRSDDIDIDDSYNHGYGFFQFTPAGKYCHSDDAIDILGFGPNYLDIPGSEYDGYAQLWFVDSYADYYPAPPYQNISYQQFKYMDSDPVLCADIWLVNYERGTPSVLRGEYAEYWFDFLSDVTPIPPDTPESWKNLIGGIMAALRKGRGYADLQQRRMVKYNKNSRIRQTRKN